MTKKQNTKTAASKKQTTSAKTPAARASKDRVCKKRGCDVKESAEIKRNANYTFRRGLCVGHYREVIRAERNAEK